jgi:exodeoxyribonuclease VII large subunit
MDEIIMTVTELNNELRDIIKEVYDKPISVMGEISNLKISRNHLYLTLKDTTSLINGLCWNFKTRFKDLNLKDGIKIVVHGNINYSTKIGALQLNIFKFNPIGKGDFSIEYAKLKKKFEKKGYFKKESKKYLPKHVYKVGIITAKEGAALKDFLYVLKNKNFVGTIYIKGCYVQGQNCPKSVEDAINELDRMDLDLIVITRGGGSYEDLFGFSSEEVIRTLFFAKTCTMSAIGHEIDFMLSDFVADIRAPTPSIAAEIVASHQHTINGIDITNARIDHEKIRISNKLNNLEYKIDLMNSKLTNPKDMLDLCECKLNKNFIEMSFKLQQKLSKRREIIGELMHRLISNNPEEIMKKGYVIMYNMDTTINSYNELIFALALAPSLSQEEYSDDEKLKVKLLGGTAIMDLKKINIVKEYEPK